MDPSINVLGTALKTCSDDPKTGWFRDGCCNTDNTDRGVHTVCVVVDDAFLTFSSSAGNDLTTPRLEYNFPGLKAGDRCVCVLAVGSRHWRKDARHPSIWKPLTEEPWKS